MVLITMNFKILEHTLTLGSPGERRRLREDRHVAGVGASEMMAPVMLGCEDDACAIHTPILKGSA